MLIDMHFDGQTLTWNSLKFKATTGMNKYQHPSYQCLKDSGPVPEGIYHIYNTDLGTAKDDGTGKCNLSPAWGMQTIPRGKDAGNCEPYWANWGNHRVRIEPANQKTVNACRPRRGGFYIHDSTKGYSHGCIEVERSFFSTLRATTSRRLTIEIKYIANRPTNGGTGD